MRLMLKNHKIKSSDAAYNQRAFWFFFLSPYFITKLRSRLYHLILKNIKLSPGSKILDLGVGDNNFNYFHKLYPYKKNITAAGLAKQNKHLRKDYPQIKYVQISTRFPYRFKDAEFDFVHSSAVIEHVGSRKRQLQFLIELNRIGKSGAITTPNRWFPLEMHTCLPLVHWLPTRVYRKIFRLLGFNFYADEKNLNLLTRRELDDLATKAGFKKYKIRIKKTLGLESNYILFWNKH